MKYFISLLLIFPLLGCTPRPELFVLGNMSKEVLNVSFAMHITENPESPCLISESTPPKVTTDKFSTFSSVQFSPLPIEQYSFEPSSCKMELTILPGEYVSISGFGLYSEYYETLGPKFANPNLLYLSLKSPSGSVNFKGLEIVKNFKKLKRGYYVYQYK